MILESLHHLQNLREWGARKICGVDSCGECCAVDPTPVLVASSSSEEFPMRPSNLGPWFKLSTFPYALSDFSSLIVFFPQGVL